MLNTASPYNDLFGLWASTCSEDLTRFHPKLVAETVTLIHDLLISNSELVFPSSAKCLKNYAKTLPQNFISLLQDLTLCSSTYFLYIRRSIYFNPHNSPPNEQMK